MINSYRIQVPAEGWGIYPAEKITKVLKAHFTVEKHDLEEMLKKPRVKYALVAMKKAENTVGIGLTSGLIYADTWSEDGMVCNFQVGFTNPVWEFVYRRMKGRSVDWDYYVKGLRKLVPGLPITKLLPGDLEVQL